ncbi:MAG: DUF2073 domain-containing protein [Candidatus Thermoplasmatota archaeon]|nr:DUF2073 domain-containing protein [archaeon]MBU3902108.1 DUF2073 domain-containing protein [Candidatus Thermoplasmatota archaeon]MBU4255678.1 DUF2073 domain-containing protein [Candidatus Thermoplasmatota archaeon]
MIKMENGVKINLISQQKLNEFTSPDRIKFILEEVKNGTVLVLEKGLTPVEEIRLIEQTMTEIDQDTFIGVEIERYADDIKTNWLNRILRRTSRTSRMAVIGPAHLLKTIHKDNKVIQAMILTKKAVVGEV